MTSLTVGYRVTGFSPRSVDLAEATVLSVGGDDFKFASLQNVSGFAPYMNGEPEGRNGRMDPLTRHVDVGTWEVTLMDLTTTSNFIRYVTKFLGNAGGANQLLGIKIKAEMTTDGTNWADLWVGRVIQTALHPQTPGTLFMLRVRDMSAELDTDMGVGRPHASATGAGPMQVLPIGIGAPYGDFTQAALLTGTIGASTAGTGKALTLSAAAQTSVRNILDESLRQESVTFNNPVNPRFTETVRVYIVRGDTGATGELRLGEVESTVSGTIGGVTLTRVVSKMIVDALPYITLTSITRSGSTATATKTAHGFVTGQTITHAGAAQAEYNIAATITRLTADTYSYTVAGTPATPATGTITASKYLKYIPNPPNTTVVTFAVRRISAPPTESTPLFIDDIHPVTFLQHVLSGYYGYLTTDGRVKRSFPYDSSTFTALAADASFPLIRLRLTKTWKVYQILEAVCQQVGLGYRMGADGEVELFDMRFPNASPTSDTIADVDLDANTPPAWEQTREGAISRLTVTYYEDVDAPPSTMSPPNSVGDIVGRIGINTSSIQEVPKYVIDADFENADVGARPLTIDAFAFRQAAGETVTSGTGGTVDREQLVYGLAASLGEQFRRPYATGPAVVRIRCRRTAVVTGLVSGSWVLHSGSKIPDPAGNVRGGMRLYRVLEASPQGLLVDLALLDAGPNAIAAVPTVGALGAGTDAYHQITVPITLNAAGDPVLIQVATTDTATGTAPAEASGAWLAIVPEGLTGTGRVTVSDTYTLSNMPAGQRVWVRARSEPPPSSDTDLPSAWAFSSGTDYQATTGLAAPSAVTNSSDAPASTVVVTLSWTNGSANTPSKVELVYVSGSGSSVTTIPVLPAGSTSLILNDYLTANTTYTPRVRHVDNLGGVSSWANANNLVIGTFTGPTLTVGSVLLLEFA